MAKRATQKPKLAVETEPSKIPTEKKPANRKPIDKALGPAAEDFGDEVKPLGKELGTLTVRTVRSLLIKPMTNVVWGVEKCGAWISEEVAKYLKDVSPEKVVEPDARISLPALQALMYAGDDETIRDMFAQLLAGDMNSETKGLVHPSFVELIKQMTADEAKIIIFFSKNGDQIEFERRLVDRNTGDFIPFGSTYTFQSTSTGNDAPENLNVAISNLIRLGLIEKDSNKYPKGKNSDEISAAMDQVAENYNIQNRDNIGSRSLEFSKSGLWLTPLAKRFTRICLANKVPDELTGVKVDSTSDI
ncbi:DUF4393 domain-containing protein [Methylobacterium sp. Leaf86]|uniref:DUF4393 domain-containing protein n=1 Tax=Methylobacterium sp. Leaf86 TaxID=1736242 RepID=UPI000B100231|nr:DUF4393 domain-containing protein [Methylobacterium sp. Leaf86]